MKKLRMDLWVRRQLSLDDFEASSIDAAVRLMLGLWEGYYARDAFKICWLVETQLREMREAGWTDESAAKELPDIIIICIRELVAMGLDPGKALMARLEGRHRGQIAEIYEKYEEMFREEFEATMSALERLGVGS